MTTPRVFGRSLLTNVFVRERRERVDIDPVSLVDRRREFSLTQRKRTRHGLELAWGYDFSHREFLVRGPGGEINLGGILAGPSMSVAVDRRDSPFNASRGWFHSSSVQSGITQLGSDLSYVRFLTRQSYYQRVGPVTIAGNVRFGMLEGYAGTAPLTIIDQLFLAGGTNSVRGYSEGELSAVNVETLNLGGTELVVLNGEVRFPLHRWLGGAAFVDAGNTFGAREEISLRKLAIGTGLGLRIMSPLAAFRFDFGYPMTEGYGPRKVRFHFSVGQMF